MRADRVYEDFEPYHEWAREDRIFNVMLPGYRRDQLKVQVTSKPTLRLMGERLVTQNRWRRFNLELPIPSDYDADNVTAKFENGRLFVQFGKLIKPRETIKPPQEAPRPKEPSQKPAQEDTPKAEEAKINNEVSDQKTPQKEESKTDTTEAPISKAPKPKDAKTVSRSKTRLIDFTLSFAPSNLVDNETTGDLETRLNKWKKMVKWVILMLLLIVLIGGLGFYAKDAFTSSSHEELYFQDL